MKTVYGLLTTAAVASLTALNAEADDYAQIGNVGVLRSGGEVVVVAVDVAAFNELRKSIAAGDREGFVQLGVSSRLFMVQPGTRARVIDAIGSTLPASVQVRILSGPEYGRAGIVPREFVQAQSQPGETAPSVSPTSPQPSRKAPQSEAQDFFVEAKDTPRGLVLWVKERSSGRLLLNKVMNGVALNGNLNTGRRAALAVTSQNSGPNMPIASGAFFIASDTLSGGIYAAVVHRARPDEIKPIPPDEAKQLDQMAAFAQTAQRRASDFTKDSSLPLDTVRLKPGVEYASVISTQPKLTVPLAGTTLVKVLQNDGAFLGWSCMPKAQVSDLHKP